MRIQFAAVGLDMPSIAQAWLRVMLYCSTGILQTKINPHLAGYDDLADINVRDDYRWLECHAAVVNAGVRSAQVFHEPGDVI